MIILLIVLDIQNYDSYLELITKFLKDHR